MVAAQGRGDNRQSRRGTGHFVHTRPGAAHPDSTPMPTPVPRFALYGAAETQPPQWLDWVHVERIPERSRLFDWEIRPHAHDALIQLLVPVSGGGEAVVDDRRWRLQPPCVVAVPAGCVHGFRFSPETDGTVITAAQRSLESLAAVAAPALLPRLRRPWLLPLAGAGRHAEAVLPLVEALTREAGVHAPGQVGAGTALLLALFVQVARLGDAAEAEAGAGLATVANTVPTPTRLRPQQQIERFRALLDSHCRQRLPVTHYAHALGLTAGQLTRLCHQVLGQSSLQAINARSLHEAQRELVYSKLSIKQVAAELGFVDEAYFGRFFKKQTGQRPGDFRAAARQRMAQA